MPSLISQESRPLIFTLFTEKLNLAQFSFPPMTAIFGSPGMIHPEGYSYRRPSRGSVVNTLESAFLDDFGEGVGMISIEGHTGWKGGDTGLLQFKNLELMFQQYHIRRDIVSGADVGVDPNVIQLWLFDTLNYEASSVWPEDFTLTRSRNRPLLYQYSMRLVVLRDLFKDFVLQPLSNTIKPGASLAPDLSNLPAIFQSLAALGSSFGSIATNFLI